MRGTKKNKGGKRKGPSVTSLKSGSGAGFTFEDKVAAAMAVEMLAGIKPLGSAWAPLTRIERQAADWEPCGDLLLTATDDRGSPIHCGVSVKSNRRVNTNGVDAEDSPLALGPLEIRR